MEKITKREMYESIIAMMNGGEQKYEASVYIDFCQNEIDLLDKKAAKAKERAAAKHAEGDELTNAVRAALSEDFEPIADIAARVDFPDVTLSKVTYRLGQLVKNGEAEKKELTIDGGEGQKKRKLQGYKAI